MIRTPAAVSAACLALALGLAARADDRPADDIVRAIEAIKAPADPVGARKAEAERADLIGALLREHPRDPRLARFLPQRWLALYRDGKAETAVAEARELLARSEEPTIRAEAANFQAEAALEKDDCDLPAIRPLVDEFIKLAPRDPRGAMLLYMLAYNEPDQGRRAAIEDRILRDYADPQVKDLVEADRRQRAKVGQPFEHRFTDAIGGKPVSIEQFRGKVVVVDFWATWCSPCMKALPRMKAIHERYPPRGVEFIGISLDRANALGKLKQVVADREIPWPQDFEGKRFETELVNRYDIKSIPTVFVVDQAGRLASVKGVLGLESILDGLLQSPPRP